jgi:ATP-dependent helicase HrpA
VKSIEDAALGMASIYRAVGLELPSHMPNAGEGVLGKFQELLAQFMPFELVIEEETAKGDDVRVSKTSVAGSWGAIAGELRYFADKMGIPRASIEGTNVPMALIRRYATSGEPQLVFDANAKRAPLVLRRRVEYHGFELERETEPVDEIPPELLDHGRRLLAEALAKGEARHVAVKNDRVPIEEIRESWRRSGGKTPRLSLEELTAIYERQLAEQNVRSYSDFRHARFSIDADTILPRREREQYMALPDFVDIRGREIPIRYDVEESPAGSRGIARLNLPEKIARTMTEAELPALDRPLRFMVTRGHAGRVARRARSPVHRRGAGTARSHDVAKARRSRGEAPRSSHPVRGFATRAPRRAPPRSEARA